MTAEAFYLLLDRGPESADAQPSPDAVMGLWPVHSDGTVGRFRGNPEYRPRDESAPSDPIDALLRLVVGDRTQVPRLRLVLRDSMFEVAMNGDGRPLIMRSPDEQLCVVMATSAPHRDRVWSPGWRRVGIDELAGLLAEGFDVFVNPGGLSAVRLSAEFIRQTAEMSDADIAAAARTIPGSARVAVVPADADAPIEDV